MYGPEQPEGQKISRKKPFYPVNDSLLTYLTDFGRNIPLPVRYDDLMHFNAAIPVYDKDGVDTLWETALYGAADTAHIHEGLKQIYSILKTEGQSRVHQHLHVEKVDYCTFGNSNPLRTTNDNNFN